MIFSNYAVVIFSTASVLFFVSTLVWIFYEYMNFQRRVIIARLDQFLVHGKKLSGLSSKKDLLFTKINKIISNVFLSLGSRLNFLNRFRERTKSKIRSAGLINKSALGYFLISKIIISAIFACIAYFCSAYIIDGTSIFVFNSSLGFFVLGFIFPDIWLHNKFSNRRSEITRHWSDMLDAVLISLTSGRSLEASLTKTIDELKDISPVLARELTILLTELVILEKRVDAFRRMARRLPLPFVESFVTDVIQAELYGTPLSKAIRQISGDNRAERIQLVEKKAAALGPKLTVPMIVFFFPLLFAVIIVPAVLGNSL